jgi:hypothetical protein
MYRPLVVVSLIIVVFCVLTTPFMRNATTATIRMQATNRVTTISTMVKPTFGRSPGTPSVRPFRWSFGGIMGWP